MDELTKSLTKQSYSFRVRFFQANGNNIESQSYQIVAKDIKTAYEELKRQIVDFIYLARPWQDIFDQEDYRISSHENRAYLQTDQFLKEVTDRFLENKGMYFDESIRLIKPEVQFHRSCGDYKAVPSFRLAIHIQLLDVANHETHNLSKETESRQVDQMINTNKKLEMHNDLLAHQNKIIYQENENKQQHRRHMEHRAEISGNEMKVKLRI